MSLPEILIWQRLRGSPQGIAFRKQHPIDPFVADFYCAAAQLVIELDGEAHRGARAQDDELRDAEIIRRGYRMIRVAAVDVLRDPDGVANGILLLAANPLHRPADGPPPRPGEDQ